MHLYPLPLLILIPLTTATCTRSTLSAKTSLFFSSAFSSQNASSNPLALSPTAKISQNNVIHPTLDTTAWSSLSSFASDYRVSALDTTLCSATTYAPVLNKKGEHGLLSLRLQVSDVASEDPGKNEVTELEILYAEKGAHMFFAPELLPKSAPQMWKTPQEPVGAVDGGNSSLTHTALIVTANTYPTALSAGSTTTIAGPTCPRTENGVPVTQHCNEGLAAFKYPVPERRWIADEETGIVWGGLWFDKNAVGRGDGLFLHEYFAVKGGRISGVDAVMQTLPGEYSGVWGTGTGAAEVE
ncbi:hypothetical protein K402DRAFT_416977 [Aulographum hederae CBS 113979]|uniref:DUF8021 domain-containing protein n=1 Tax=Aulographum hederae CBS 113979 TaxID=1176131 RepID=A0A6G1HF79_9PEZI|nr:hypothetical protein K402DRAFT_416977 [Aulographum hederae CBS 113979]